MRSNVQYRECRKAPTRICQPRKDSFSSSPGYSITTVKLSRRTRNRGASYGIFHPTIATGWLRPRVWRFWNWKQRLHAGQFPALFRQARGSGVGVLTQFLLTARFWMGQPPSVAIRGAWSLPQDFCHCSRTSRRGGEQDDSTTELRARSPVAIVGVKDGRWNDYGSKCDPGQLSRRLAN
jgi:hypothetical protein